MIYNYEAEFLNWMNHCIPEIKQATYASDEDLLNGLDSVREFPAFYYSRDGMNVDWNKTINVPVEYNNGNPIPEFHLYPYEQHYTGTIFIENQAAAFRLIRKLKYYWNQNPYIMVKIPGIYDYEQSFTKVGLWLQTIGVDDVRLPNDKNGACRAVRFKWFSNLLLSDRPTKLAHDLVEHVHIGYRISEHDEEHGYPKLHEDGYIVVPKE